MTLLELLLATYASVGVLLLAVWRRASRRLWKSIGFAGVLLAVAILIEGRH
jgi:hypothetical protein